MIGTRLGGYQITAKLGEGGMGEVYRARDARLEREVAIKVLPEALLEDEGSLARFEREARVLAQLHHPHVASIFGLEERDGVRALVMELVEGPTLAERLQHGPLPLDEALEIAGQIAEALEAAHEKGIVHRDLKPGNVKAPAGGPVKVLDFGLAKAMDPTTPGPGGESASRLASSPTLTLGATRQGVILGTAAYMAPEQAKGALVDKRADIWAFGVVLWEMLVGRRLFDGDSVPEVLAGVLKNDVDLDALPSDTPPAIRRLLRRCLARNPKNRLHDIADARIEIEEALAAEPEEARAGGAEVSSAARRSRIGAARVAIVLLALLATALAARIALDRPEPPTVSRTSLLPPENHDFHLDPSTPGPVVLLSDGRQVAFVARNAEGVTSLWVREVGVLQPRRLEGTEDARYPFWSPDGRELGFFDGRSLKKVAVAGGPPVSLAPSDNGKGGSWSPRGVIVYAPAPNTELLAISAAGGEARSVTRLTDVEGDSSHRHPRLLPDGEHFLFLARSAGRPMEIRIGSLDGSSPVPLLESASNAEYASGHLLFLRGSTLMAQPFDPERRRLSGSAVPLVEGVAHLPGAALAVFSTSSEGSLVHQTGTALGLRRLVWRDRKGVEVAELGQPAEQFDPRISPDGTTVAVGLVLGAQGAPDIWVYDVARGLRRRLTFLPEPETSLAWSPDGSSIAFTVERRDGWGVHVVAASGGSEPVEIASAERGLWVHDWTKDGSLVLSVFGGGAGKNNDIGWVPAGASAVELLIDIDFYVGSGVVSPDGRWLAYDSSETGGLETPRSGSSPTTPASASPGPAASRAATRRFFSTIRPRPHWSPPTGDTSSRRSTTRSTASAGRTSRTGSSPAAPATSPSLRTAAGSRTPPPTSPVCSCGGGRRADDRRRRRSARCGMWRGGRHEPQSVRPLLENCRASRRSGEDSPCGGAAPGGRFSMMPREPPGRPCAVQGRGVTRWA